MSKERKGKRQGRRRRRKKKRSETDRGVMTEAIDLNIMKSR